MTTNDTSRRGFTLIELLVVIAIIAILAAILFPIFASAKRTAQRTHCLNNAKQIATAISMYGDANNGSFPISRDPYTITHGENLDTFPYEWHKFGRDYWAGSLLKYTRTNKCFICKAAPQNLRQGLVGWYFSPPLNSTPSYPNDYPVEDRYPSGYPGGQLHYGMNQYLVGEEGGRKWKSSTLPKPSRTALVADCFGAALFHDWNGVAMAPRADGDITPEGMLRIKYANGPKTPKTTAQGELVTDNWRVRHGGPMVVFADFHAAYVPFKKVRLELRPGGKVYEYPLVHPEARIAH